jgi:hypothetical protein
MDADRFLYATPTNLWGQYRRLHALERGHLCGGGELAKEDVFGRILWPGFASRYRPGSLVSQRSTYRVVEALWPGGWNIRPLTLADAIVEETGKERCADPGTAERLGALIDPAFLTRLEREEQETISRRLREICFRAQDGKLCPAKELIAYGDAAQPDDREEKARRVRSASGPREQLLGKALQFLKVCRAHCQRRRRS